MRTSVLKLQHDNKMHSSALSQEVEDDANEAEVLVGVATLVTEGRVPGQPVSPGNCKTKGFHEGPHCAPQKTPKPPHECNRTNPLCRQFQDHRDTILRLCKKGAPLCVEVIVTCPCNEGDTLDDALLLEQWHFRITSDRTSKPVPFKVNQLVSAIRSQLYFSQLTAWLVTQRDDPNRVRIVRENLRYRLCLPEGALAPRTFSLTAIEHRFPAADIGNGNTLNVWFCSAPRSAPVPSFNCANCSEEAKSGSKEMESKNGVLDDRMHTICTLKGKHRCEDFEENDVKTKPACAGANKRLCHATKQFETNIAQASTSDDRDTTRRPFLRLDTDRTNVTINYLFDVANDECHKRDLKPASPATPPDKGQILLDAIERTGRDSKEEPKKKRKNNAAKGSECNKFKCDTSERDIIKEKNSFNIYVDKNCDNPVPTPAQTAVKRGGGARQRITFDGVGTRESSEVPTPSEQAKFRKSLGNATSMVFHSGTGLPLTSSPAPMRKGKSRFDFDSSLNSVSAIKSALFSDSLSIDDESESDGSIVSPCSPEVYVSPKGARPPLTYRRKGHSSSLLGTFEESVLNGRLEPVSTVQGFRAELGASGSFVPKHAILPVTVFFYTFCDNDKVSSPYLGHINLGRKGYNVPKTGTVQITLFNPLGTVVKMFVVMYDLSDMPPNSQTFIRQRTLFMPTGSGGHTPAWEPKWLRYLIHLRFMSSKSGKIYLHSDVRMIVFRKCDVDTATAHDFDLDYDLRSFTQMPTNPKYSSRK
ncbi:atos homolog protein A [Cylas formicarius]|uniref:atos homolog protein A n=1 Tax=Cylas formicarius TaxID=197179 RepID=UPI002958C645|nr:atos homolog protein A [Cylas formicarius]